MSRSVSWCRCPWSRLVRSLASLTETMKRIASFMVSCFPVSVWKILITFVYSSFGCPYLFWRDWLTIL